MFLNYSCVSFWDRRSGRWIQWPWQWGHFECTSISLHISSDSRM